MIDSYDFLKSVIDTVTEHIVVIDSEGHILFVNKTWKSFGQNNACSTDDTWDNVNYLSECDKAAKMGDEFGLKAANGVRAVINGEEENFYFEYPCHSPDMKRWFMMRVTPFTVPEGNCFVISHQNITERKLAEEEVLNLSRIDGLTEIANRRYFNEFLDDEWRRCQRLCIPISLVIIDLDHFKYLNDTYGHQVGDDCLKAVGQILKRSVRRPSDICARYGGEEFSIVYGNTSLEQAKRLADRLLSEISALEIPNEQSPILPILPILTASIGLATMQPDHHNDKDELIKKTDESLYAAKENGRNQIFHD